jgi:hypothetical protein
MPDGFSTTICPSSNPAIQFWEKTVKPPGFDGGTSIDTTTMLNKIWRTMDARHLKSLAAGAATCAYDPDFYAGILALLNAPQSWTVHFPSGDSLSFYANLEKAEFQENKEGEMPLVDLTLVPTNWDPAGFVEAGPVYTPAAGT